MTTRAPLAEMLLAHGLVDDDALEIAIDSAAVSGRALLTVLLDYDSIEDGLVARMLSSELNLYRVDLDKRAIDNSVLKELDGRLAHHHRAVPVGLKRTAELDHLYVAVSDPTGPGLQEIQASTEKQVIPLVATESALQRVLSRLYPGSYEPIGDLPNPVEMPAFADVVVGHVIEDASPHDLGGDEWLTASTQEVLEIYAPTLNAPETVTSNTANRDDDWLRQRLQMAQGDALANPSAAGRTTLDLHGAPPAVADALAVAQAEALAKLQETAQTKKPKPAPKEARLEQRAQEKGLAAIPDLGPLIEVAREQSLPTSKPTLATGKLLTLVPINSASNAASNAASKAPGEAHAPSEAPFAPPRDSDPGLTIVCEDQNIRLQLRTALADVVEGLYDHRSLADATAIIANGTIRRVILLYPRADGQLVTALRALRSLPTPPTVLVISRNRAFEVMRGVSVRIEPPDELARLPEVVFDALARVGTR